MISSFEAISVTVFVNLQRSFENKSLVDCFVKSTFHGFDNSFDCKIAGTKS